MLLLDTHALIWLATDLSQLTTTAKSAIRFHASELHVSAITALEISLLRKCGKLKWGKTPLSFFERALNHHGVTEIPLIPILHGSQRNFHRFIAIRLIGLLLLQRKCMA